MEKKLIIQVQNIPFSVSTENGNDFICLTDMANAEVGESRAADFIKNWLRNRYTLEFLGIWIKLIPSILKWSNLTTLKLANSKGFVYKSCSFKYTYNGVLKNKQYK